MKIYIPLNEKGMDECEYVLSEETTENMLVVQFTSEDYWYLYDKDYFEFLNTHCDSFVDLWEEEDLKDEQLTLAIEITRILMKHSDDERYINLLSRILEYFQMAVDHKTYVNIFCFG